MNTLFYWSPALAAKNLKRWWLNKRIEHYEICAATEEKHARQAALNARHYQQKAMLIRSDIWRV